MRRFGDALIQALHGMFRNGLLTFVSIFVLISCLLFIGRREISKTGRLTDDVTTRVLSSCIASVGGALVTLFTVGFDAYVVIGGIFSACAAGAMTFLFVSLFDRRYFFPSAYEIGRAHV